MLAVLKNQSPSTIYEPKVGNGAEAVSRTERGTEEAAMGALTVVWKELAED